LICIMARPWRPSANLALVAALAVVAVGEAARAEYPRRLIFARMLSAAPDDVPMIREASAPLFDAAAAGATREWANPRTGNSGAIKLRRIFALKDMPCRTFDYTTWTKHHTNQTRVVFDWCRPLAEIDEQDADGIEKRKER
jgi:hypothetical protein